MKMVGSTNVPRNTHSTILSAVGQGDGEAAINIQIQRQTRASLSSVLASRPELRSWSAPLPEQVGGRAIGRGCIHTDTHICMHVYMHVCIHAYM